MTAEAMHQTDEYSMNALSAIANLSYGGIAADTENLASNKAGLAALWAGAHGGGYVVKGLKTPARITEVLSQEVVDDNATLIGEGDYIPVPEPTVPEQIEKITYDVNGFPVLPEQFDYAESARQQYMEELEDFLVGTEDLYGPILDFHVPEHVKEAELDWDYSLESGYVFGSDLVTLVNEREEESLYHSDEFKWMMENSDFLYSDEPEDEVDPWSIKRDELNSEYYAILEEYNSFDDDEYNIDSMMHTGFKPSDWSDKDQVREYKKERQRMYRDREVIARRLASREPGEFEEAEDSFLDAMREDIESQVYKAELLSELYSEDEPVPQNVVEHDVTYVPAMHVERVLNPELHIYKRDLLNVLNEENEPAAKGMVVDEDLTSYLVGNDSDEMVNLLRGHVSWDKPVEYEVVVHDPVNESLSELLSEIWREQREARWLKHSLDNHLEEHFEILEEEYEDKYSSETDEDVLQRLAEYAPSRKTRVLAKKIPIAPVLAYKVPSAANRMLAAAA